MSAPAVVTSGGAEVRVLPDPAPFDLKALASMPLNAASLKELNDKLENGGGTEKVLEWAWTRYGSRASIGTSFQGSGLVMIDIARRLGFNFPVFTLDTGLLFPETLELKKRLEGFFGITIEALKPDLTVEEQEHFNGPELWKRNPDLCCTIRKVMPLRDKL